MSKRVHNNSRKSFHTFPSILRFWQSHRWLLLSSRVHTHLVTWDSATSTVRGLVSLNMVIFYRWVLQQCWVDPGVVLMHFFLFVQIMLSWKEWGVLQIWNTDAGLRTTSRAACYLCTVPERPRSSAVLIHSAQAFLSAVKKHGQVSVCFGSFDSTYIINCSVWLWQNNQFLFFGVKKDTKNFNHKTY